MSGDGYVSLASPFEFGCPSCCTSAVEEVQGGYITAIKTSVSAAKFSGNGSKPYRWCS